MSSKPGLTHAAILRAVITVNVERLTAQTDNYIYWPLALCQIPRVPPKAKLFENLRCNKVRIGVLIKVAVGCEDEFVYVSFVTSKAKCR